MDSLQFFREQLQRLADETREPWLLLDGFAQQGSMNMPSRMSMMHGVPKVAASPEERSQAVEEFNPR